MMGQKVSRHLQIIAIFIKISLYSFENYEQLQRFIQRTTRVAKRLDCYELSRIWEVLEYLKETADYKVTLETVEKYILEDIPKLKGEEPIITLKSGERVYDIDRLKELESKQIIHYDNGWIENNKPRN